MNILIRDCIEAFEEEHGEIDFTINPRKPKKPKIKTLNL